MNQFKVLRNNKGAALVSIMIAVAFITILATAMLYMTFNNYKMKVVNYESKANFYETEQRMTKMSTKLRNEVMASSNPLNTVKTATGVNADNRYSTVEIAKLAFPGAAVTTSGNNAIVADSNGDIYTFSTAVPAGEANYLETPESSNTKKITLKGVQVKQLEARTQNVNKITTDLVMYIQSENTPADMGGIGEFSLMMDSSISASSTAGTKINVFGNGFFLGVDGGEGAPSLPGRKSNGTQAIYLTGECTYNLLGDYTLVYGDIVLTDGAALNIINGSLTVYGNIYLDGKSTLTCNGRLYFPDETITDSVTGNAYGIIVGDGNVAKHIYPSDLMTSINRLDVANCQAIVTDLKLDDTDPSNDGLVTQILAKQKSVNGTGAEYYYDDDIVNTDAMQKDADSVTLNGITYNTRFFSKGQVNGDLRNKLAFLKNVTAIKESNENSTIISRDKVTFEQVHELNLTKMGTNAFDYLTLKQADATNFPGVNYIEGVHRIQLGNGQTYEVGGFLQPNANTFVQNIMGMAVNSAGGTPTYASTIGYQNWSKE